MLGSFRLNTKIIRIIALLIFRVSTLNCKRTMLDNCDDRDDETSQSTCPTPDEDGTIQFLDLLSNKCP